MTDAYFPILPPPPPDPPEAPGFLAGDFAYWFGGDGPIPPTPPPPTNIHTAVAGIFSISHRLVRVVFNQSIVINNDFLDPRNYKFTGIDSPEETVVAKQILPIYEESTSLESRVTQELYIETSKQTPGVPQYLHIRKLLSTKRTELYGSLPFAPRFTKVDSALRSIQTFIDSRHTGNITAILRAVGLEDDNIGGDMYEVELPPLLPPPSEDVLTVRYIPVTINGDYVTVK